MDYVCGKCETNPLTHINGVGVCVEHIDRAVEPHAPMWSGPVPVLPPEKRSPQKGVASHTPRHYK